LSAAEENISSFLRKSALFEKEEIFVIEGYIKSSFKPIGICHIVPFLVLVPLAG
jgi:hypothetical protein